MTMSTEEPFVVTANAPPNAPLIVTLERWMEVALVMVRVGMRDDPPMNCRDVMDTVCEAERVREPAPESAIDGREEDAMIEMEAPVCMGQLVNVKCDSRNDNDNDI